MGVCFFQNGVSIGSNAGWGGYTGSNNYVVRYDFTTGALGATAVTVALSGIYYGTGAGTQGFGFKIGTSAAAYANARNETPDSSLGYMSYSGAAGYGCTMSATGLNLSPNTAYYIFVYAATAGAEYYTGWNCLSPQIVISGSYVCPCSTISSMSAQVTTQGAVSLIMNRSGSCWHKARFSCGGETLGESAPFAAALSHTCPRSWMEKDVSAVSITVDVAVQTYTDSACTVPTGEAQTGAFTLTADADMRPAIAEGAVTAQALNNGAAAAFGELISGISRARVSFDEDKISVAACAGAYITGYRVAVRGRTVKSTSSTLDTGVLSGDCTLVCSVTDSRGREDSVSLEISMLPYVPPSLSGISAVRCGADGAQDEAGQYFRLKAALGLTPLNGVNSAAVSVCIQPTGGQWSAETALTGFESGKWSHEWEESTVLGGDLTGDSYTLHLKVTDSVGGTGEYTLRLYHQQWAMKFNAAGSAVGFGMAPTVDSAVQLPDSWRLYAGAIVLSENSYGSEPPGESVENPAEGQLYFCLTD